MNWEIFTTSRHIENLGWALVHSLWQIALIALVLFALLQITRRFSPHARYLLAVSALVFALVLPAATLLSLEKSSSVDSFQRELSATKNTTPDDINPRRSDKSVPLTAETPPPAPNEAGILASFEDFQSYLSENISALLPFIVVFWGAGAAFSAFRLSGGVWQLHLYKTRGVCAPADDWQERFTRLCRKLEITKTIRLLQSDLVETPIVVGWLKPFVIVPASVFLQLNPRELEMILAHELVHVRRFDCLVNFAQNAAEALLFYHPCAWWISSVIRREREFATDAAVIEIFAGSRVVYANALANLEEVRQTTNKTAPSILVAANGGHLMHRISKILQKKTGKKRSASAWSAGLALALVPAVLLAVFSFNQTSLVNAQKRSGTKKLAIGFVSIPPLDRSANPPQDADATARLLIEKLKAHKIPAIGFLLGAAISDGEKLFPVRANIVRLWRDAGFEVGIGNFKHVWFYDTPYDEYLAGVEKNEQIARKLLAEKNLTLRYFSYPFLNTGKTADDRTRFEKWLAERGITPVKYTIDNQEWMYSYAYEMARKDNDIGAMTEIRVEFVKYMSEMFDHYEAYSQEMFGRDIAQTMVLTPSRLVADSSDDLFGMIEKRGYRHVSMDEALKDAAYQTGENFAETQNRIKKSGISWFERWQMAQGKKLRDEPPVSESVSKIWNERKPSK